MKIKNLSIILIMGATTLLLGDCDDKYDLIITQDTSSYDYNGDTYILSVDKMDYQRDYCYSNNMFILYTVYKQTPESKKNAEDWGSGNGTYDGHLNMRKMTNNSNSLLEQYGQPLNSISDYPKYTYPDQSLLMSFNCYNSLSEIKTISADGDTFGWVIYYPGICGNTFSYEAEIIIPLEEESMISSTPSFITKSIFTKRNDLLYHKNNNKIDIYYTFQDWGSGGTAWSQFIPRKKSYDRDKPWLGIYNAPITIDDIENVLGQKYFITAYMSGFYDLNPELMQHALDNYYDDEDICETFGPFFGIYSGDGEEDYIEYYGETPDEIRYPNPLPDYDGDGQINFGNYCSKEQFQEIIDNMPWNELEIENGND